MTSTNWQAQLQQAQPAAGFQPLPAGVYRFRVLSGAGKLAQTDAPMISVQLEVLSGPKQGKKIFHNWVLPFGRNDTDPDKVTERLGYFLGDMLAFGITKEWLVQNFPEINKGACDTIAGFLVNQQCKATVKLQANDSSRNNVNGFTADDGVEPAAPVAASGPGSGIAPPPAMPGIPGGLPTAAPGLPPAPAAPSAPAVPVAPQAPALAVAPPPAPAAPALPTPAPALPGMPGMPAAPPAFQPPAPPTPPVPAAPAAPAAPQMPGMPAAPQASF